MPRARHHSQNAIRQIFTVSCICITGFVHRFSEAIKNRWLISGRNRATEEKSHKKCKGLRENNFKITENLR